MIASVYIELTNVCNLTCKHCYNASGANNKKFIDANMLLSAIDRSMLPQETIITLSGGEPLLHPEILYIIESLSHRGFKIDMVTNGTLLTKEIAMFLEKRKIRLQLSIDGTRDIHDFIRGSGAYDKLMHNLKIVDNYYTMDRAVVKAVLTKLLLGHVSEYVEEMAKLKFSNISFGFLSHSGRAKDLFYSKYAPNCDELIRFDYEINKAKEKYPNKVELPMICYSCGLLYGEKKEHHIKIDVEGNVYICQGFNDIEYSIGNISHETIENSVSSDKFYSLLSKLRERQKLLDCSTCVLEKSSLCNKGCPAEEVNLNGSQGQFDDKCRYRVNRSLLELVQKDLAQQ